MIGMCTVCGVIGQMDRCHIKSQGAGGTWEDENIVLMCRRHHTEQHAFGWDKFIERYPNIGILLEKKGWEMKQEFGRKRLVKK